jgi:23S rRNA (adenine2503-C2)-methyltransferase
VAATPALCEISREELAAWCQARGQPRFRAEQILRWLTSGRAANFECMTDLPVEFRQELAAGFAFLASEVVAHQRSRDGTEKLLLRLADGELVETVLMREADRRTVCLSTQVGCGMGCVFCASGLSGLTRNLAASEIIEQALRVDRLLPAGERLTNVVVMGMGEPLANLPNLLHALALLESKLGLGLSPRRVTISTVGLPERIADLAETGKPYNLAVSLHAPNDALRSELVPVNARIGIEAIMKAAHGYFARTGRRVSFEYVLLEGRNDAPEHARELALLLRGRNAHINLIPMNPVEGLPFHDPARRQLAAFVQELERAGVTVTVRKRKGADIDAACGQLRLQQAAIGATGHTLGGVVPC